MKLKYNEEKTTQAAAYLIKKRGQGFMSYMKLIKLLYYADREAWEKLNRPITFDNYVSMKNGTVLSRTLEVINGEERDSYWEKHIEHYRQGDHEVKIKDGCDPGTDSLSESEIEILDKIFAEYGSLERFKLGDLTHTLPEWKNPGNSMIPIDYAEILRAIGKTPSEIKTIENKMESYSAARYVFGSE